MVRFAMYDYRMGKKRYDEGDVMAKPDHSDSTLHIMMSGVENRISDVRRSITRLDGRIDRLSDKVDDAEDRLSGKIDANTRWLIGLMAVMLGVMARGFGWI